MSNTILAGVVHKVPTELKEIFLSDVKALALWNGLTPLARNEWLCWISFVKKEETRKDHLRRTIIQLKEGKRRPCCWLGCIHRTDKKISRSVQYILDKKQKK